MRIHSYVIQHDLGFAPNPFWGVCTLACCKPRIRKHAKLGDYVVGTGGAEVGGQGRLTYWMRVDRIMSFDEYWKEPPYVRKRAFMAGGLMDRYGDNIYHRDPNTGDYIQEDSFHSEPNGVLSEKNFERDTGTTDRMLIGREFAYWGGAGPRIPDHLSDFIVKLVGHKNRFKQDRIDAFMAWLNTLPERGYQHEPADWRLLK